MKTSFLAIAIFWVLLGMMTAAVFGQNVSEECTDRYEYRLLKGPLTEREAEEVLRAMREHKCVTIDGVECVFRR